MTTERVSPYANLTPEQFLAKVKEYRHGVNMSEDEFRVHAPQFQKANNWPSYWRDDMSLMLQDGPVTWASYISSLGGEKAALQKVMPRDFIYKVAECWKLSAGIPRRGFMQDLFLFSVTGQDLCLVTAECHFDRKEFFFVFEFPTDNFSFFGDKQVFRANI